MQTLVICRVRISEHVSTCYVCVDSVSSILIVINRYLYLSLAHIEDNYCSIVLFWVHTVYYGDKPCAAF